MTLRRDLLQIVFGAILTALFIQMGVLSPNNQFFSNIVASVFVYTVTRVLALIFGGRR